ncbi:MAG: hypothetical protein AAFY59_08515, partial [Pseudomonadota bacterium]
MSGYILKTAEEDVDLPVRWRTDKLMPGERVREDLGWQITPVAGEEDLAVSEQHLTCDTSFALLAGGVPGKTYMVSAQARTDKGRDLVRSYVIRIADEPSRA